MAEDSQEVVTLQDDFRYRYGPFFTYKEFKCKCDVCNGPIQVPGDWFRTPEFMAFMRKLIDIRTRLGWPFQINSGHRCVLHPDEVKKKTGPGPYMDGPHTIGAADIGCAFERAYQLNREASILNMGVGPTQHGPVADRFIHVDNQGPRIWTY